ncbi:sulfite exporter TauE/SafE family protein 3-like [Silene latifolia]|uniref:sulfite exporter TauE/SafE family protein 3-like n=1 Tax=Silene latifolia TaxID=37657 RepID=UPI003D77D5B3
MVTILLIIAFLGTSTRSFFKGVEMWKKETIKKKESAQHVKSGGGGESSGGEINRSLLGGPSEPHKVSLAENVNWKQLWILVTVWLTFLAIQIVKDFTDTCSLAFWVLNLLQIPVAVGVTLYQAIKLIRRRRVADNLMEDTEDWEVRTPQLIFCALVSLLAGTLGGLLGLGGGFLLGPMFLEMGIIPQVSSATATFVMTFSASICAIEYYLLDRFPVPYAAYLTVIAIVASIVGQYVVKKWIARAGRASLIVFILSTIIFASAILLGGEGIVDMIHKIKHNEYMGFEDLCSSGGDEELTRRLAF